MPCLIPHKLLFGIFKDNLCYSDPFSLSLSHTPCAQLVQEIRNGGGFFLLPTFGWNLQKELQESDKIWEPVISPFCCWNGKNRLRRCPHCDPPQLILSITPKNYCSSTHISSFLQILLNNPGGPEGNAVFWCGGSNLLARWLFARWLSCLGVGRASPPCSFHSSSPHCLSCWPSSLLLPRCSHLGNS